MPSQASTSIADPMDISLPSQLPKGHPNFESRRDRIPSTNGRESLNESPEGNENSGGGQIKLQC